MNAGFLTESDGTPSSYRLMMLVGVFLVLGVWAFLCIYGVMHPVKDTPATMVDFTWNAVTVIGILVGGKVWSKTQEQPSKGNEPPAEVAP